MSTPRLFTVMLALVATAPSGESVANSLLTSRPNGDEGSSTVEVNYATGRAAGVPPQFPAANRPYRAFYAFGHSWTATRGGPYSQGRWANGPVWIELLSTDLGLPYQAANNFAAGGATSQEVVNQVSALRPPGSRVVPVLLVVVCSRRRCLFNSPNLTNDLAWMSAIRNWVGLATNAVRRLYAKGARSILVQNFVDPNRMPRLVTQYRTNVDQSARLSGRVTAFNLAPAQALTAINLVTPDLHLFLIDMQTHFDELVENFASSDFSRDFPDATSDSTLMDKSFWGSGRDYVFWDSLHPTAKAHALIAERNLEALTQTVLERLIVTLASDTGAVDLTRLHIGRV